MKKLLVLLVILFSFSIFADGSCGKRYKKADKRCRKTFYICIDSCQHRYTLKGHLRCQRRCLTTLHSCQLREHDRFSKCLINKQRRTGKMRRK
jgi:hypothetical protein